MSNKNAAQEWIELPNGWTIQHVDSMPTLYDPQGNMLWGCVGWDVQAFATAMQPSADAGLREALETFADRSMWLEHADGLLEWRGAGECADPCLIADNALATRAPVAQPFPSESDEAVARDILKYCIEKSNRRNGILKLDDISAILARHRQKPAAVSRKFGLGQRVTKIKGSQWTGLVVGFYSTELTPVGYAVESENEKGSVQIYPESALKEVE